MTVRPAMGSLISRTRDLIGDQAAPQHFSDQQVQDRLDETQQVGRLLVLTPQATITTGGGVEWRTFLAPLGDWESDATFQANNYALLATPTDYSFNEITGVLTTTASQYPPIFMNGQTYDINLAAANLADRWANDLDSAIDIRIDDQSLKRSQRAAGKRASADRLRSLARVRVGQLQRSDSPQPIYPRLGRRIPRTYR